MNQSREMIEGIGIDVYDSFGGLRDVGDIIDDLGASFGDLSSETQQMLGLQLAGRFQLSRFLTLMQQYEQANLSTASAINSQNSAISENERFLDSHEAKINKMKNSITGAYVTIGESFADDAIVAFVDAVTGGIKAVTGLIEKFGTLPIILSATAPMFLLLNRSLSSFVANGIKSTTVANSLASANVTSSQAVSGLNLNLTKVAATTGTVGTATAGLTVKQRVATASTAMLTRSIAGLGMAFRGLLASTGVGIALVGVGFAIEKILTSTTQAREESRKFNEELERETESFSKNSSQIKNLSSEYLELKNKTNLTREEQQKLYEISNDLNSMLPSLTDNIDDKGQAHLRSADAIKTELGYLERMRKLESQGTIASFDDNITDKQKEYDDHEKALKRINEQIKNNRNNILDANEMVQKEIQLNREREAISNKMLAIEMEWYKLSDDNASAKLELNEITQKLTEQDKHLLNQYVETNKEMINTKGSDEERKQSIYDLSDATEKYGEELARLRTILGDEFNLSLIVDNDTDIASITNEQAEAVKGVHTAIKSGETDFQGFISKLEDSGLSANQSKTAVISFKKEIEKLSSAASDGILFLDPEGQQAVSLENLNSEMEENQTLYIKTKDGIKEYVEGMDLATGAIEGQEDAVESLTDQYNNASSSIKDLTSILDSLNEGQGITADVIDDVVNKYPELIGYLDNETALREQLKTKIAEQGDTQRKIYMDMLMDSESYFTNIKNGHADLYNDLASKYKVNLEEAKSLAHAKLLVEEKLIDKLKVKWGDYFSVVAGRVKLSNQAAQLANADADGAEIFAEQIRLQNKLNELAKDFDNIATKGGTLDLSKIGTGGTKLGSGSGTSTKSSQLKPNPINQYIPDRYTQQLSLLNAQLDQSKNKMSRFAEGTQQYNDELQNQISLTKQMQAVRHAENNQLTERNSLIKQALSAYDNKGFANLTDEHKERFNRLTKELEENTKQMQSNSSAWWDNQRAIESTNLEYYTSLLVNHTNTISDLNFEMDLSQRKQSLFKENSQEYTDEISNQQSILQKLITEEESRQQTLNDILSTQRLTIEQEKEYREELNKSTLQVYDYQASIQSLINTSRQKITNILNTQRESRIKQLEQELTDALENIQDKIDDATDSYDEQIEKKEEQLSQLDEQIEKEDRLKKLQELNDEMKDVKNDKRFSYITENGEEILTYDKGKYSELEKQRADLIQQYERDDLRSAIQKEIDDLNAKKDKRLEVLNQEIETTKTKHQEQVDDEKDKWDKIIQAVENGTLGFNELMNGEEGWYAKTIASMETFGLDAQSQVDNIKSIFESLNSIKVNVPSPNMSSPNGSGSGSSGGSSNNDWSDTNGTGGLHKDVGGHDYGVDESGNVYKNGSWVDSKDYKYIPDEVKEKARDMKKYHDGGIIGQSDSTGKPSKLTELANKLFNTKPNEQIVKALKNELFVPENNIAKNFLPNIQNLMSKIQPNANMQSVVNEKHYHFKDLTIKSNSPTDFIKQMEFLISSE